MIDHAAYPWRAADWRGRPWQEAVILEAHVGTFTREGTYRAIIDKLDHLVETGITALELMPLADFAGSRNWGYDGVLWYAPDSAYGRPEDLKALIDDAHQRGLMVMLDVVYNHFGPEGNYLGRYAPSFFTEAQTPWGSAIDYRVAEVRAFAIENALHWLRDYRFDGLRLDAVHAIVGAGRSLDAAFDLSKSRPASSPTRPAGISISCSRTTTISPAVLDPGEERPRGKYRAQWNDDYHHAWHVLLTGETHGYYRRLSELAAAAISPARSAPDLSIRASRQSIAAGNCAASRATAFRRSPSSISCRTTTRSATARSATGSSASPMPKAIEAALAITLLAPTIPMLFMGEEWGSKAPFPFFCDFKGELAERRAARAAARSSLSAYDKYGDEIPDPLGNTDFAIRRRWIGRTRLATRR